MSEAKKTLAEAMGSAAGSVTRLGWIIAAADMSLPDSVRQIYRRKLKGSK